MRWWKNGRKAALDATIASSARPASRLIVEATESTCALSVTGTHFGGEPYAEGKDTWPTIGRRPYDLICQINLREFRESPRSPFDIIVVFLCWKAIADGDMERACLVRHYSEPSPAKAIALHRPKAVEEGDYRVVPCRVTTERVPTYPWSMEGHPAIRAAASEFKHPHAAYRAALRRLGYQDRFFSRVGGFPTWVHDNTLEGDGLVFLAQIDYEPQAENCIGDAAPIYIAFSATEPATIETDVFQSF